MKKLTIEYVKEFCLQRNIICLDSVYVNIRTMMRFVCSCGREYNVKFDNIHKGSLCKDCSVDRVKTTNIILNLRNNDRAKNIIDKRRDTYLNKTGYTSPAKNPEVMQKMTNTSLKKYGVEHPQQNKEIQEKTKVTNLKRYGTESPLQNLEIRKKIKYILLDKTGYDTTFSNPDTREKIKATNLKKYGVSNVFSLEDIKEKMKITNLERYGAEYPQQNKEISNKTARSQAITKIKYHWLTNEELVCQGSYEAKVIDYLNINKINYQWQPKVFKLSKNTYKPDLYLIDEDKWIEIKGRKREDAMLKWKEFIKIQQNSEMWDSDFLKKHNII